MLNGHEGQPGGFDNNLFGKYEPKRVVTNEEIEGWKNKNGDPIVTIHGTPLTAQMIEEKLGIKRRSIANERETIPYMALQTAQDTLKGRRPDVIFVSTSTPVGINLATHVEDEFGFSTVLKSDVHFACTGFAQTLNFLYQNYDQFKGASILALSVERLHPILVDLHDPDGSARDEALSQTIFSDRGSGLFIPSLDRDIQLLASGEVDYLKGADFIRIPTPFAELVREPYMMFPIMQSKGDKVEQRGGRVVGAVRENVPSLVRQVAVDAGFELSKKTVVVPHMASKPVLDEVENGLPEFTVYRDIEDGNCSSGSIPKAMEKAISQRVIDSQTPVIAVGFGAGIAVRAGALRFPLLNAEKSQN